MNTYSLPFSSAAQRDASRIWRDLKSCRVQSTAAPVARDSMAGETAAPAQSLGGKRRSATALARTPHVCVVGAGLAGLRCADVLLARGFRVTVLEGRSRVGGRVHQELLTARRPPSSSAPAAAAGDAEITRRVDVEVDAGPNWIHGTVGNPILAIARRTGTAVGAWDLGSTHTVEGRSGLALPPADSDRLHACMWDVVEAAFRHSNAECASIDPGRSLWAFFLDEVPRWIPETEDGWEAKRALVLQMAKSWGAFVGSPIETQSLKFFWLEECLEGENLFCAGTYKDILKVIAKPALEGAQVRLGTTVARIHSTSDEGGPVRVEDQNGVVEEFDEVVFTAPLGWLKRHPEAFDPPLPARITKAIASIGYGCLEKVYITFPRAFWLGSGASAGVEGQGEAADGATSRAQGFCKWLEPEYAAATNPRRWEQEALELASPTCGSAHPTLLFYMYGDQSRHLVAAAAAARAGAAAAAADSEAARLEKERQAEETLMIKWFEPYYTRLPGYSAGDAGCRPAGCYATRWLADELAGRGSYSNFQVGLEEGDADIEAMRRGAPERGLWLAGEHTAPFVALGTATGAYWSGEAVARRVAAAYGRDAAEGDDQPEAEAEAEKEVMPAQTQ